MSKLNKGYGNIDVLFLIEHKDRELDNAIAIKNDLEERYRLNVEIKSIYFHSLISLISYNPRIIIVPFSNSERDFPLALFREVFGDSIIYLNLNLEQILHKNNLEYKRPKDEFSKMSLRQVCWGESFREYLLESGVNAENIKITGNPAITLLKKMNTKENNFKFKEEISQKCKIPVNKRWFFFPMNDGWAFVDKNGVRKRIMQGYNERNAWEYRKFMKDYLHEIIKWFCELDKLNSNREFLVILRPHPSVPISEYESLFNEYIGRIPTWIHLSRELTIKEWLIACEKCFTTFSTVALDANRIGKSAVLMTPIDLPEFISMEWMRILPNIKNFSEFNDELVSESAKQSDIIDILNKYVDSDLDAISETSNYIFDLIKEQKYPNKRLNRIFSVLLNYPQKALSSLIRLILFKIKWRSNKLLPAGVSQDYFEKKDIKLREEHIKLILNKGWYDI